jgi:hypothetical protein
VHAFAAVVHGMAASPMFMLEACCPCDCCTCIHRGGCMQVQQSPAQAAS